MKIILILVLLTSLSASNWTIMVYMCADNSLADMALIDLEEMEEVGSGGDYTVVAQLDLPDQEAARIYVGKGGSLNWPIGEVDMCDGDVLYDFVNWARINYPADKYVLILWDHGSGWTYQRPQFGFGTDWSSNNTISFVDGEMRAVLERISERLGKKIDLLVFDACLLGLVEIAAELEPACRYLIASQRPVPVSGLPYDMILNSLADNPDIKPEELGRKIVDHYFDDYKDSTSVGNALWHLDEFDNFRKHFDEILRENMRLSPMSQIPQQVYRAASAFADLGSVMDLIDADLGLDDLVVYHKDFAQASGAGIWLPDSYYDFRYSIADYQRLNWTISQWEEYLNFTYDQDDIPPTKPIVSRRVKSGNNVKIDWHKSYDLAPVHYQLYDASSVVDRFFDQGDSSLWQLNGFYLTTEGCYYSGSGSNIDNSMVLQNPLDISGTAMLTFELRYEIQLLKDTFLIEYGDGSSWQRLAYYYGDSGWEIHKLMIPYDGSLHLRFRYRTDGSISKDGAYVKNILISELEDCGTVTIPLKDTSFYFYNQNRGEHYYIIEAVDRYDNRSDIDNPVGFDITNYAEPYSVPNPFYDDCHIIYDAPADDDIDIYIFTIDGKRVRKFQGPFTENSCFWDGRDNHGKKVDDGVYVVLVKGTDFKKLGKIARVD